MSETQGETWRGNNSRMKGGTVFWLMYFFNWFCSLNENYWSCVIVFLFLISDLIIYDYFNFPKTKCGCVFSIFSTCEMIPGTTTINYFCLPKIFYSCNEMWQDNFSSIITHVFLSYIFFKTLFYRFVVVSIGRVQMVYMDNE